MSLIDERTSEAFLAKPLPSAQRCFFAILALLADMVVVILSAIFAGLVYHTTFYGEVGPVEKSVSFGVLIALIFVPLKTARGSYSINDYAVARHGAERDMWMWTASFLCILCVGFLTRMGDLFSRGAVVMLYGTGMVTVTMARLALSNFARALLSDGRVLSRRTFLIGHEAEVLAFHRRFRAHGLHLNLVGSAFLSSEDRDVEASLAYAVDKARALAPDDIIIALPWSNNSLIERCIEAFMTIPAAVHLAPERILDRFDDMSVVKLGPLSSLQITRPPHHLLECAAKRGFDIAAASLGLVLLAPLFAVTAVLIKLDSPGPVFFLQRRSGFNQKTFRIFKFRTMTTLDDGAVVRQATKDDKRITRVGRILRRYSIDELPQLLNVLWGDMSIVGPRPHAIAHNRAFEQRIALYARRHNVKPGITGWAQVNGLRGETDTDDKMRLRVEYDLHYIDNWSLLFDVQICLMTVFNPSIVLNAY